MSDMSLLRVTVSVSRDETREPRTTFEDVIVDTGSELNWFPAPALEALRVVRTDSERFETADGRIIVRDLGFAWLATAGRLAPAVVVFGEPDDKILLGAVGLESLRLRVDLNRRQLVAAGPLLVTVAC